MKKTVENKVKRFMIYGLLAVTLLTGATMLNGYKTELRSNTTTHVSSEQQTLLTTADDYFSQRELPFSQQGNQEVRIIERIPGGIARFIPDTDLLRIIRSKQLALQKIYSSGKDFINQLSHKESYGFYLFFLCKILI
ncbi:MAG: hypothetical protein Q7U47_14120 [Paludibacter sp.]|nr:hypothetical protein [Paludibacter sp.]